MTKAANMFQIIRMAVISMTRMGFKLGYNANVGSEGLCPIAMARATDLYANFPGDFISGFVKAWDSPFDQDLFKSDADYDIGRIVALALNNWVLANGIQVHDLAPQEE